MTKETRKIEIENDFVWYRKGEKMSALDVICKFCYIASKAIAADPSKNIDEKQAKQKLMQLIFAGTGILITDSGNITCRFGEQTVPATRISGSEITGVSP